MSSEFSYRAGIIRQDEGGIVCFNATADDIYDDKDLIAMLDLMEQASDGNPFLLLMISNGHEFLMTKEARSLFNTYPKAQKLIIAEAVVIGSTSTKILYNLLTLLHKPSFPFKAFTSEKEAREWLLKHV
jgi:hypothetical protein